MKRTVVLLGRLGHGKTYLFNKLCGTSHLSAMTAGSCTREVVAGCTQRHKVTIIDTPGFGSSDSTDSHIEAQRRALESHELSGIILVVKYGAPSDMANGLNHIMDFVGTDNVCIIVTHAEVVLQSEQQFDDISIRASLSRLLGVVPWKILLVGKDTNTSSIEDFVYSRLDPPKSIHIDQAQLQFASTLAVGTRRFKLDIENAKSKSDVALQACQALLTSFVDDKVVQNLVMRVRDETARHMDEIRRRLSRESESLSPEVQQSLRRILEASLCPSIDALKHLHVCAANCPNPAVMSTSFAYGSLNEVLSTPHRIADEMKESVEDAYRLQSLRNDEAQHREKSLPSPKRTSVHSGSERVARRCTGPYVSEAVRRFESPAISCREFHFDCRSPTDVQVANANCKTDVFASSLQRPRMVSPKVIGTNLPTNRTHGPMGGRSLSDNMPPLPCKPYPSIETRSTMFDENRDMLHGKSSLLPPVNDSEYAPPYKLDGWEILVSRHRVTTPTATLPYPADSTTSALDAFLYDGGRGRSMPYGPLPDDDCDSISL